MSADLELGDGTDAQGEITSPTTAPVENGVPDMADSISSDDSETVSDNIPVTPSDLPPPLASAVSEPHKPTTRPNYMVLPHGSDRGSQQSVGSGLRAPLMSNTSSTPIPPSLQAKLAAVSFPSHSSPQLTSICVIG